MNLKQVEAFVAVADTRSFSKAAGLLYLTQPTVSSHISGLEKELKVRLLARTTKEVILTSQGEQFYELASEMLNIQRKMERMFITDNTSESKLLKISASSIPAQYLLPDIIKELNRSYPKIRFNISESDSAKVIRDVSENKVDIGFTGTQIDVRECKYINLVRDEIVIACPNNERYTRYNNKDVPITWVLNEPVIAREEGSGTRRESENMLQKQGIDCSKLNIIATFESSETIKQSVKNGLGITFISKLAIQSEIEEGLMIGIPISKTGSGRYLNMVYNNHTIQTKSAEQLISLVRKMYL